MFAHIPTLGVGLGFREPFRSDLFLHREQVDFLEITAEHYLAASPEKEYELEVLADHFTLIPHALSLSLGSAEGLDSAYLRQLAALIQRLDPPWWSEHLAFTRAGGIDIGHLSPLPFSSEAAEVVERNVAEVRRWVEAPLILENITSMITVPGGEMSEAEFVSDVLERTECGLLLDVTNVYTNATNQGYDPYTFVDQLPLERVVQLHFAGGHWHNGILIDSHSQPTPSPAWELMEAVVCRARVKGIILERDDNLPPFTDLLNELERARGMHRQGLAGLAGLAGPMGLAGLEQRGQA